MRQPFRGCSLSPDVSNSSLFMTVGQALSFLSLQASSEVQTLWQYSNLIFVYIQFYLFFNQLSIWTNGECRGLFHPVRRVKAK